MNPDRSRVELYDVPNDPMEMNNLAGELPEVREDLAEQLLAWKDDLPESKTHVSAGRNEYPWPGEEDFDYMDRRGTVDPSERWGDEN
jgi:hypothetical protein